VKENRKAFNGSFADRLDCILRACNRNQTIGIPVGPETSRIVAEIISSRIDQVVSGALPNLGHEMVDRLQDDWFVGVQSVEFADLVVAAIIKAYRDFELDINGEKTSVDRVKTHLAEDWVQDISAFLSHRPGALAGARLRAFLALILRLQISHPKAAVVRYGISVLEDDKFARADIEAVESFLLKAAHIAPTAMDRISSLLINLYSETKSLSRDRITRRLTELAQRNLLNSHTYEALWQLYAIRGLSAPFASSKIVDLCSGQSDSALQLLLLDMNDRGLCTSKLPIGNWETMASPESIETNGHWLLAYEGIRHGWLKDPKNLSASRFFEPMLRRNVVFYDPRRNVRKTAVQTKVRALMKKLNRRRVQRFMTRLRGFEPRDDYF
jgi:hypothetical protein